MTRCGLPGAISREPMIAALTRLEGARGGDVMDQDATAVVEAVRTGDVSAGEVLKATMARLEERNPVVNAVVAVRDAAADDVERGLRKDH